MAQSVSGKKITLTKGDTLKLLLELTDSDGETYTPASGDVIRFAMKEDYEDSTTLANIEIPNDTLILTVPSSATKSLDPGNYVYDIQITYDSGDVDTFIDRGTLVLTEEVD